MEIGKAQEFKTPSISKDDGKKFIGQKTEELFKDYIRRY